MSSKIKVLVNGHDQKFWFPLQKTLEATGKYEFKEDFWPGHDVHDEKKSEELLQWADIIICEWALGNAVYYSQRKLPHQKIIIRLHLQERNTEYPKHINYDNVSAIIFVGQHILDECIRKFNIPREITYLIPNIIDVEKFNKPKFGDSNFVLGIVGIVPLRKRIDLAFETLKCLHKIDKRYTLRIKGASPASYRWVWNDSEERAYYEKVYRDINSSDLRYSVIFDPPGNDVDKWFQSVGYILSPSDFESFHVAPAEGMASGTIPIIWKREGSSDIFPTVVKTDTPELAAQQIDFYRRSRAGMRYSNISQKFIINKFDANVTAKQWEELLLLDSTNNLSQKSKPNKDKLLIFFSIGNWETFHRREMIEALAKNLHDTYNFLIIEPGEHYRTIVKNNMASVDELDPMLQLQPKKVAKNIYTLRVMTSGLPRTKDISHILLQNSNRAVAIYQSAKHIFGEDTEILYWIFKHDQLPWVQKGTHFIYEIYDDYTMNFETGEILEDVLKGENKVIPKASHVFFTSEPLADRKAALAKSWSVVGNGVNYDIFEKYRIAEDTAIQKRPVVGYLGNLSDFFNWELMCEVVETMPEIDFIFYGQIEREKIGERAIYTDKLMALPNTVFTGRVTREEGAVGINLADVLIIPFVINDAMHAVNPLKLWEYFATGKPVVSSPMDAINISDPVLRVAKTSHEWKEAIEQSIIESDTAISQQRINMAQEHSWDNLTRNHISALNDILNR